MHFAKTLLLTVASFGAIALAAPIAQTEQIAPAGQVEQIENGETVDRASLAGPSGSIGGSFKGAGLSSSGRLGGSGKGISGSGSLGGNGLKAGGKFGF